MKISLIQVPYHLGQKDVGVARGPAHYIQSGVQRNLQDRDFEINVKTVQRSVAFEDELSAIVNVNSQLAACVKDAVADGDFPLVLAGDCNSCLGTLAGFDNARLGVIWFDAHGDFNTPETSISGFFDGMSLAITVGHCYKKLWAQIGKSSPIPEFLVLLAGVRDLDPKERERLELSKVHTVTTDELKQTELLKNLRLKLEQLQSQVNEIYLHIDIDVLDPEEAPGAGYRCPNGISSTLVEQAISMITKCFQIKAVALTNYRPEYDEKNKTVQVISHLLGVICTSLSLGSA